MLRRVATSRRRIPLFCPFLGSRFLHSVSKVSGTDALTKLLGIQGFEQSFDRNGLHPLVVPLASDTRGTHVIGLLHWPSKDAGCMVVSAQRQTKGKQVDAETLWLRPLGTVAQFARRAAVEADAAGSSSDFAVKVIDAAATVAADTGSAVYAAGELAESRLRLPQFLLMRVGPFADVWEEVVRGQLAKGDTTAALIAGERNSSLNRGWGCCMYAQSTVMAELGRDEEQRDLALAALEAPFWTLGAPVRQVLEAAKLSHIEDVRTLMRVMEDQVRTQQGAPPRTAHELALLRALDAMDDVVRCEGSWDESRATVAAALEDAGLTDAARVAAPL